MSLLINALIFFTAGDEVYKSSRFTYERLSLIMDETKPRQTLDTVSKTHCKFLVFVKILSKFKGKEVFKKCAIFTRSNFATLLFLHSANKLLISPLFPSPSRVVYVQPF
jgi:hypothetical protein